MKLSCEIVQDLLPLYEDELCSEESRKSVEEHLEECPKCRKLLENMKEFKEPDIPQMIESKEEQVVAKSFRKIRRRWRTSLIALLLVIPMIVMSMNQIRGFGICFTNIDDILLARRYIHALVNEDFEKVASYMDYEHEYRLRCFHLLCEIENLEEGYTKIQPDDEMATYTKEQYSTLVEKYQELSAMNMEEFIAFMKPYYINQLKDAMDDGYVLTYKGYDECYYNGNWVIGFNMELLYKGKTYFLTMDFSVNRGKIVNYVGGGWKGDYLDETEDTLTEAIILDYPIWD